MPALDFPANPTNGQSYSGYTYNNTTGAWLANSAAVSPVTMSDSVPPNPTSGDMWFNTSDATMYLYYNDGSSSQWVEARAPITSNNYYSPNYIINGAFDVWQRGTSSTAAGFSTADRWYGNASATTTFSRESSDVPLGFQYAYKMTTGATAAPYTQQSIETTAALQLAGKTVTLSGYLKASTALSVSMQLYFSTATDNSAAGSWTQIAVQATSISTVWTRYQATFTVPTTAKSILAAFVGPSVVSGTSILVTGIQLEEGSVATPFRRHGGSYESEFDSCRRFLQRYPGGVGCSLVGVMANTTQAWMTYSFPIPLRATPTSLIYSGQMLISDQYVADYGGTSVTASSVNCNQYGGRALFVGFTGLVAGRYASAPSGTIGSGYLEVSAEI